ncbi:MAG: ArnT family glycosyltransferase [Chitinophagales bacterium]
MKTNQPIFLGAAIFLVSYLILSFNIGGLSVYALDEARNAECAREMYQQSEWIIPTFNYQLRPHKPPLHYYFMMFGFGLFGVSEFAARFFGIIAGAMTILTTFLFVKQHLNQSIALRTVMVLLASLHFSVQVHMAVPDPYLILFVSLSLFAFYNAVVLGGWRWLLTCYISMGLATLTKGPVAIAVPGLIMLLFLVFSKRFSWQTIKKLRPFLAILVVLLVVVPWYYAVHIATDGEWTRLFFLEQNVQRFTNTMEGHGGSFFLPLLFVLFGMLPFTFYSFELFKQQWGRKKWLDQPFLLFCLLVSATFILFFGISSTKLPNYTTPTYPFVAVLLGYVIWKVEQQTKMSRSVKVAWVIYLLLMSLLPFAAYYALEADASLQHLKHLGYYFAILPVFGLLGFAFLLKNKPVLAHQIITGKWIALSFCFFYLVFPKFDKENPVLIGVEKIEHNQAIGQYKISNQAFVWYLAKEETIPSFKYVSEVKTFFEENPEGYLLTRKKYVANLQKIGSWETIVERKDLFETPTTVILKKKNME